MEQGRSQGGAVVAGGAMEKRRKGDEKRKMMLTSRARMSLRGECKYNEKYVSIYTCSWARVVFIRILWHI
jgi:hypothetical protein